jgi:tetratricopeptide (TPR) repeat protein
MQPPSLALSCILDYIYFPLTKKLEKHRFKSITENFTALTGEEANDLLSLEKEFPYSQVIRSLAARATQDNLLPDKEDHLHLAAIYTTDRAVFKAVMSASPLERKAEVSGPIKTETVKAIAAPVQEANAEPPPPNDTPIHPSETSSDLSGELLYDELARDLARLKDLKHQFEEAVKNLENGTSHTDPNREKGDQKKKSKQTDSGEDLLSEIKNSKKKIKPEGPKQKEQIEIIDQFIKTQPSIKGKVAAEAPASQKDDLSEKSLIYGENIISETLAQILIKQGKKDKAIEVFKKLIWKFPQKKAYFAAQIEDLKK